MVRLNRTTTRLAVSLGALLPIYEVTPGSAPVLDVARYVLCAVLVLLTRSVGASAPRRLQVWFLSLSGVGLLWLGAALLRPAAPVFGPSVMIAATSGAFLLARHIDRLGRPLLEGYAVGVVISALAGIAQHLGYLGGSVDAYGVRVRGLSSTSTLYGFELVTGLAILTLLQRRSGSRWAAVIQSAAVASCVVAILVSGTRAALLVAAITLMVPGLRWLLRHPVALATAAAGAAVAVSVGALSAISFSTVERLLLSQDGRGGFVATLQASRASRNSAAFDAITGGSLFEPVAGTSSLRPHMFPLVLGLQAGWAGLAAGALLAGALVLAAIRAHLTRAPLLPRVLLTICALYTFIEPTGPFVGLARVLILMLAIGLTAGSRSGFGGSKRKPGWTTASARISAEPVYLGAPHGVASSNARRRR